MAIKNQTNGLTSKPIKNKGVVMISAIKNLPETIHQWLYDTDERYKSLHIQLELAKQCENEDQKDLVLQTISTEYGSKFI